MSVEESKPANDFQVSDRRFWVQDEDATEMASIPQTRYPSYIEELKARTEAAEQKLQEKLKRIDEDNAAYRERLARRSEQQKEQEITGLVAGFLEVLDNLERALESSAGNADPEVLRTGVELTLNLFLQRLSAAGVSCPELQGETFDPNLAEAVGMDPVSDPGQDGRVVAVVQKAYMLGGTLLRPARVRVGRFEGH
jgi:molecular chaperone GrpE